MAAKKVTETISRPSKSVVRLGFNGKMGSGWEKWFLLQSDEHWDHPKCDRKLYKEHLDEAIRRDAWIVKNGDLFCLMQGRYDKRSSRQAIRPEHATGDNYSDLILHDAVKFHKPYAHRMLTVGLGNHETAYEKKYGTNMAQQFVALLNAESGTSIQAMGYTYWLRLLVSASGKRTSLRMKCAHGFGGGGPVTRDVIRTARMAVYLPDADIVWTGHTHDSWVVPIARERILLSDKVTMDYQTHIKTATYKDEYGAGEGGWHVERGGPPKPIGACWLRLYINKMQQFDVQYEAIPALGGSAKT